MSLPRHLSLVAFIGIAALSPVSARISAAQGTQGVLVTPRSGARVKVRPRSERNVVIFRVTNVGNARADFTVACATSGHAQSCRLLGNSTLSIAAGQSVRVPVRYVAADSGSARVTLTAAALAPATGSDSGAYDVAVNGLLCVEGCGGGGLTVEISPHEGTFNSSSLDTWVWWCSTSSPLNASTRSIKQNGTSVTSSFTYTTGGTDCIGTYGATSTGTLTLALGQNTVSGSIYNNAGEFASDQATLTYTPLTPNAPVVDISMNPGSRLARSACVTADAGPAGAFQCGDLVIAHAMPAYVTMDHPHTLQLLYNSAAARPYSIVMADVSLPANTTVPDRIDAVLSVNGVQRATASFSSNGMTGFVRRIALGFDPLAAGIHTGVFPYTLQVTNVYGSQTYSTSSSGDLIVVERRASPYGAGWSVAGAERVYAGQRSGGLLWVGADGSALAYDSIAQNVWLAPVGAYRDTMRYAEVNDGSVPAGWYYWQYALDGTRTFFDWYGRLVYVVDRIGNKVEYGYAEATAESGLSYIRPAPWKVTRQYQFSYTASKLTSVRDPASPNPRVLTVVIDTANLLTSLLDSGAVNPVRYGYDANKRLTSRQSRMGAYTRYGYYTNPLFGATGLLKADTLPVGSPAAATAFQPVQLVGLAEASSGNSTGWRDTAYVRIDGPRTDVSDITRFLVNSDNSPTKIIDALGNATSIQYATNAPLLPSQTSFPNGRVFRMRYDALARLEWTEDDTPAGQRDSTKYVYGDTTVRDQPTQITVPLDATRRLTSTFVYNTNGTLQQATNPRNHVTTFTYTSRGQDSIVTEKQLVVYQSFSQQAVTRDVVTIYHYDSMANRDSIFSDAGGHVGLRRDQYGNVRAQSQLRHSGGASRDSVTYDIDVRGFQRSVTTWDTTASFPTAFQYDDDGHLLQRTDPRSVSRYWEYDPIGRDTAVVDEFLHREKHRYDAAGNLTTVVSRSGRTTTMSYDALNRLQTRILAAVPDSVTIASDTSTFTYGVAGTILPTQAVNRNALTIRTYALDGSLLSEYDSLKWIANTYSKTYGYNRAGARVSFVTPQSRTLTYGFDNTGSLASIGTPVGTPQLRFHDLGMRDSLWLPDGSATKYRYDGEGMLRRIYTYHPNMTPQTNKGIVDTYLYYDLMGRPDSLIDFSVAAQGASGDKTIFLYDGRGNLRSISSPSGATSYTYDASGNRLTENGAGSYTYTYFNSSNRLWHRTDDLGSYWYRYNDDGAVVADSTLRPFTNSSQSNWFYRRLKSYYDASGRLAVLELDSLVYGPTMQLLSSFSPTPLELRYDALGRQIVDQNASWGASNVGFDGSNALELNNMEIVSAGSDEPLMMLAPSGLGVCGESVMYFVTSGNRLLDYHRPNGTSCIQAGNIGWEDYGKHAGAIAGSFSFGFSARSGSSGLSLLRNRAYDARTGRFNQEDPIGFSGGSNLYAYAGNNPASLTDRFGLCPETGDDLPCVQEPLAPLEVPAKKGRDRRLKLSQLDMTQSGASVPTGLRGIIAGVRERLGDPVCKDALLNWGGNLALDAGTYIGLRQASYLAKLARKAGQAPEIWKAERAARRLAAIRVSPAGVGYNTAIFGLTGPDSLDLLGALKVLGGFAPFVGSGIAAWDAASACL